MHHDPDGGLSAGWRLGTTRIDHHYITEPTQTQTIDLIWNGKFKMKTGMKSEKKLVNRLKSKQKCAQKMNK